MKTVLKPLDQLFVPVWWMRVGNDWLLALISKFSTDLKEFSTDLKEFSTDLKENSTQLIQGFLRSNRLYKAEEFKFEFKFKPCWSSGNHSRRLFQKTTIERFDCKINGQAFGAPLRHSLDGLAQMHFKTGRFRVCCSCDRLAWGKNATTFAILTWLEGRKGYKAVSIWAVTDDGIFSRAKWVFDGNYRSKPRLSLRSIFRSSIGLWAKMRHRNKSAYWILWKAADLNRRHFWEMTLNHLNPVQSSRSKWTTFLRNDICSAAQIPIERHNPLLMMVCKSSETISGMILNQLQPNVCSQISHKWNVMLKAL